MKMKKEYNYAPERAFVIVKPQQRSFMDNFKSIFKK
jgi:hypothetical protein